MSDALVELREGRPMTLSIKSRLAVHLLINNRGLERPAAVAGSRRENYSVHRVTDSDLSVRVTSTAVWLEGSLLPPVNQRRYCDTTGELQYMTNILQ